MGSDNLFKKNKYKREKRAIENKKRSKLTVYIFTEGTKTETQYFNDLVEYLQKDNFSSNIEIIGVGRSTRSLLNYVESEIKKSSMPVVCENIWLLFDKDDFSDFNNAIMEAKGKGYNVAWSNECFELWYILHYEFLNSAISREDYCNKLGEHIGKIYKKDSKGMFEITYPYVKNAIKNCKALSSMYNDMLVSNNYTNANPCTKVYELVEFLQSLTNE